MITSFLKVAAPRFTKEEELELWRKYTQENDIKALKKLKLSFRPAIQSVVSKRINIDGSVTEAQIMARIDGEFPNILRKYDPNFSGGASLGTFIIGQTEYLVSNAVKENQLESHVPRSEAAKLDQFRRAKSMAQIEFGKNPSDSQILKYAPGIGGLNELQRIKQYNVTTNIGDAKHTAAGSDGGTVRFKDLFSNDEFDEDFIDSSLRMDEIKRLMKELNPQEKRIVEEYVFNNRSLTDIALSVGLSSSSVRNVLKRWEQRVKESGLS